ncbi:MAG: M20 aminoacylase family protein [Pseudomonadota bacterium]
MPVINRFSEFHPEIVEWRKDFHAHPELLFDVHRTAAKVAEKLREFGVDEVVEGIGRTGVVGIIKGRQTSSNKVVGLRADMDALPIQEIKDHDHKSKNDGVMHACGHDGHTAMLLGAAKYLAETRNFDGTIAVIFQPAEEGGGGGREMVEDGMMDRFGIQQVYGMHNMPGLPAGHFSIREGGQLASVDFFSIEIEGRGGHAARPQEGIDPAIVISQLIPAFQTIVSRNTHPLEGTVVSVTQINMGHANNVIPQTATMAGTVRTLTAETRDLVDQRMTTICENMAQVYGCKIDLNYERLYPVTVNHPRETAFAASIARDIVGPDSVNDNARPTMGGEDFAFMLQERPGAFIFVGQGDSAGLHHPEYDFNDDIIPIGCSYWVKLAETAMPLQPSGS